MHAVAGPDVERELVLFQGHELHVVRGHSTLTFQHTYDWKGKSFGSGKHVILT